MSAVAERCVWRDGRFEVAWLDADGAWRRAGLAEVATVAFEEASPVRGFASFRGQRNFPGLWWLATTGEHVGYESWLERDQVMVLDADPCVVGVSSQPLWLHWTTDGRAVRHVPDFFVRLADGTAVVLDVRADDQIPPQDAAVFATTAQACALVGWTYRRVGGLDPVLAANLRWLAGYRHPRCLQPQWAAQLQQVFAQPRSLMKGVVAVGDPIAVLPVLFHLLWHRRLVGDLLWHRRLVGDLTASPLGPASLLQAAGRST
jgi:hypothetical protein